MTPQSQGVPIFFFLTTIRSLSRQNTSVVRTQPWCSSLVVRARLGLWHACMPGLVCRMSMAFSVTMQHREEKNRRREEKKKKRKRHLPLRSPANRRSKRIGVRDKVGLSKESYMWVPKSEFFIEAPRGRDFLLYWFLFI